MWNWKAQRVPAAAPLSLSDLRRAWDKVKQIPANNFFSILLSSFNSDTVDEVRTQCVTYLLTFSFFHLLIRLLDSYQIYSLFDDFYASFMHTYSLTY